MKTFLLFIISVGFTFLWPDKKETPRYHANDYCAKFKDGKLVVIHAGAIITSHVKLEDGSIVKTDGTVINKDSAKINLQDGECIDKYGKISTPKPKQNKVGKLSLSGHNSSE